MHIFGSHTGCRKIQFSPAKPNRHRWSHYVCIAFLQSSPQYPDHMMVLQGYSGPYSRNHPSHHHNFEYEDLGNSLRKLETLLQSGNLSYKSGVFFSLLWSCNHIPIPFRLPRRRHSLRNVLL